MEASVLRLSSLSLAVRSERNRSSEHGRATSRDRDRSMSVLGETGRSERLLSHARELVSIGSPGRCAKTDSNDKLNGVSGLGCAGAIE